MSGGSADGLPHQTEVRQHARMSRTAVLLLSLLAACTFHSAAPLESDDDPGDGDNPGDPNDPDGDGAAAADNCPDIANADQKDEDGDGIGDACDNCAAIANPARETVGAPRPVQRDHDADGRGDECDLCPHLAAAADGDRDSDLIGDACDPEPDLQNPAPYWNGFYEAPGDEWNAVSGAGSEDDWELAELDGKVGWRQRVLDGNRHQLLLDGDRQEHFVQSSVVLTEIQSGVTLPSATITYGFYRQSGVDYFFSCGPRRNATTDTNLIVAAVQNTGTDLDSRSTAWTGNFVGAPIDITARGDRVNGGGPQTGDTSLACDTSGSAEVTLGSTLFPDGRIGLRTFGATAWFDYIFAVEPRPRN